MFVTGIWVSIVLAVLCFIMAKILEWLGIL